MRPMIDYVIEKTVQYLCSKTKSERKKIGQFFTSKETAQFMASLFSVPTKRMISILDPGAGTGILSAALLERLQQINCIAEIQLTCYENEPETSELLESNLKHLQSISHIPLVFEVIRDNYITSQRDDFNQTLYVASEPRKYDLVIGNPPYKKVPKEAPEATAMPLVCYGAPNLYFLFAAMSLFNLSDSGEMVYIIPRSWTSGAYFKAFRDYFLTEGKLTNIHLFVSRDKVFDNESVLQETIIVKLKKQRDPISSIEITSTHSNSDFGNISKLIAPYPTVVSDHEHYVFLVTNQEELDVLTWLSQFSNTLPSLGIRMKTGLTVDFRNRELLRNEPGENVVPMFYAQHIKDGQVVFPVNRDFEYISEEQPGLIQKNRNFLFVKRFTAKEERRRLQSGIYLSKLLPKYHAISTQNKINFVDSTNGEGLPEDVVYGLYVLFNSTLYDTYYRILNGSTQVNSTEINAMPVPPLSAIQRMGKELQQCGDLSVTCCDNILREALA